jgi:large subunit ribosomal protein L17
LRNLASALFLTERDAEHDDNAPKVKGRIITTLQKAKEVRPLVEKCITIARKALPHEEAAESLEPTAERHSDEWRSWRNSTEWQEWNKKIAPAVAARRRAIKLLGDKEAVRILFDEIAPRFEDRPGGYTRILKLADPRLGDAGRQAILEFVGQHDRVRRRAERPAFEDEPKPEFGDDEATTEDEELLDETALDEPEAAADEDSSVKPSEEEEDTKEAEKQSENS